jgi:hypothetical protein
LLAGFFVVGVSAQTADFELSGDNVVPPVSTTAGGSCSAYLNAKETSFTLNCSHNALVTSAHIHEGAPGANGPVVFFLESSTSFSGTVSEETLEQQKDDSLGVSGLNFEEFLGLLRTGSLYVNVHTDAYPGGEIRGNIPAPTHELFFSQYGAGGGLSSEIVVLNTSATTASAVIDFFDPSGNEFLPSESIEVPGFGSSSFFSSPEGETPVAGTARVTSDRRVGANVVFSVGSLITGVSPSPALTMGVVPVSTDPACVRTAVALSNPDPDGIDVELSLYAEDGTLVDEATISIPGNGQIARFVDELFDLGGEPFYGVLKVEAVGESAVFTGVGVQQGASQFTTVQFTEAD